MSVPILLDHILEAIHRDLSTTLSLRSILRLNYGIQLNISCNMDMGTNCESIWPKICCKIVQEIMNGVTLVFPISMMSSTPV